MDLLIFQRESPGKNWSVNPMFLVAIELKNTTHWENPQRNPWQILVTEVEATLQPSPNALDWAFVTFATSQQAMDAKVIVLHLPCKMLGCRQKT